MEKKKRRRSIRNLRRQSLQSFSEDVNPEHADDSIIPILENQDNDTFGTVWVETNEESLKSIRKKRRSSIFLQKPVLQSDSCSPELEKFRENFFMQKTPHHEVSPDLIKMSANPSPMTFTPTFCFSVSPKTLDVAFVSDIGTPKSRDHLVTEFDNKININEFDNLTDCSPMMDVCQPNLSRTDLSINGAEEETNLVSTDLQVAKSPEIIDVTSPGHVEATNSTPEQTKESEPKKVISPTSIVEGLDHLATGAVNFFNSIVHSFSHKVLQESPKSKTDAIIEVKEDLNQETNLNNKSSNEDLNSKEILLSEDFENVEMVARSEEDLNIETIKEHEDINNTDLDMNENLSISYSESAIDIINRVELKDTEENMEISQITDHSDTIDIPEDFQQLNKENKPKKRRSKRRSAEFFIVDSTSHDENHSDLESSDENSQRKSKRNRRKSLDIYQAGMNYDVSQIPEPITFKSSLPQICTMDNDDVESLYLNKTYTAPIEKMWETIYESPNKSKQFISKKRYRRLIDFEGFAPAKFKKRLQKAYKNGFTALSSKSLSDDFVQLKLSELYTYLDKS